MMDALNDMREALSHGEKRTTYTAEELAQHMENDCMIVGYDDVPTMLRKQEAEIQMLRTALRQVAQAHAWLAFGECRAFGPAPQPDPVAWVCFTGHGNGWRTTAPEPEIATFWTPLYASPPAQPAPLTDARIDERIDAAVAAERERIAAEFDSRDKGVGGFYDAHEPAEIIRAMSQG
jgi:hypothetical protein